MSRWLYLGKLSILFTEDLARLCSNCPARVLLTVADTADSEAILRNKSFDDSQLLERGNLFFNGDRCLVDLLSGDRCFL